jgi:hypothetical protein
MRIPLPSHSAHSFPLPVCTEDVSERVFRFSHVMLWLCANALALCHQREIAIAHDGSPSHRSVEDWMLTFRALVEWYESRPPEFQVWWRLNLSIGRAHILNSHCYCLQQGLERLAISSTILPYYCFSNASHVQQTSSNISLRSCLHYGMHSVSVKSRSTMIVGKVGIRACLRRSW